MKEAPQASHRRDIEEFWGSIYIEKYESMDEFFNSDWTNDKGYLVLTVGNCFKTLMMSSISFQT